jgi:hypothetical protein
MNSSTQLERKVMEHIITLLNKAEAAECARIKPVTLDKLIKAGKGPAVTKVGGRIFFQPVHINTWLQSRVSQTRA